MDWLKGLFSRTPENKEVEMKRSPEELKQLEEDMKKLDTNSIERLQKEIEYTNLSHELYRGMYSEQIYKDEIARLEKLLKQKLAEQEEQDESGAEAVEHSLFSSFGGKRTKSKNAKPRSKKSKRTKVKTTKGKKTRSKK